MITTELKISTIIGNDDNFIQNKVNQYSYAYRYVYSRLIKGKYLHSRKYIKNKFGLTTVEYTSLLSDVQTRYKQTVTNKSNLEDKIIQTENKIKSLEKITNKTKKEKRLLFKLNNKLVNQNNRLPKDIVFGSKFNLKKISYLNNQINNQININPFIKKKEYNKYISLVKPTKKVIDSLISLT
jgi:hypothetical protein